MMMQDILYKKVKSIFTHTCKIYINHLLIFNNVDYLTMLLCVIMQKVLIRIRITFVINNNNKSDKKYYNMEQSSLKTIEKKETSENTFGFGRINDILLFSHRGTCLGL